MANQFSRIKFRYRNCGVSPETLCPLKQTGPRRAIKKQFWSLEKENTYRAPARFAAAIGTKIKALGTFFVSARAGHTV